MDSLVDITGSHALSCMRTPGRAQRHHFVNDLIWRSLSKAGFISIKEPQGLLRSDGKRSNGLTLIPWQDGRCATWDITVTDIVVTSYLSRPERVVRSLSSKSSAATRKEEKYSDISKSYLFPCGNRNFRPYQSSML